MLLEHNLIIAYLSHFVNNILNPQFLTFLKNSEISAENTFDNIAKSFAKFVVKIYKGE